MGYFNDVVREGKSGYFLKHAAQVKGAYKKMLSNCVKSERLCKVSFDVTDHLGYFGMHWCCMWSGAGSCCCRYLAAFSSSPATA